MKYLFMCREGLQRSPTAAKIAKELLEANGLEAEVYYAGINKLKRLPVELASFDRIYVMEEEIGQRLTQQYGVSEEKVVFIDIPDMFPRDDPGLQDILREELETLFEMRFPVNQN